MERKQTIKLPPQVITVTDMSRLQRELEEVDTFLTQAALRKTGSKAEQVPRTTAELESVAKINELNLLEAADRKNLKQLFELTRKNASIVHISFASEPAPKFLHKIMEWFREEIDPSVLFRVGLQPGIAAGCIVRTKNKYFDMSLRKDFDKQKGLLADKLYGGKTA